MTKEKKSEYALKYRRGMNGLTQTMYSSQKICSKRRGHLPPSYNLLELREWVFKQKILDELINNWKNSEYDKWLRPSIDRLDDDKGYSLRNIRLVTWKENDDKAKEVYKGEGTYNAMNKSEHETISMRRNSFKRSCKRKGWIFENFAEVFSGEMCGRSNKYFYFEKVGN